MKHRTDESQLVHMHRLSLVINRNHMRRGLDNMSPPLKILIEIKELAEHTHHHLVFGDPTVWREVLQHGYEELQAAIPVAQ